MKTDEKIFYLAFDIECAQAYPPYCPICNFGYVIFDENFILIKKEDIIINPRAKFRLTGRKKRADIQMAYSLETYNKSPIFPKVYQKIKKVLDAPNTIILNHSISNDISYLNGEIINRYKTWNLKPIDFKGYDIVDFVKAYYGVKKEISLSAIKEKLNLDDFIPHKADDDANIVILIVKKMLEDLNINFDSLIELSEAKPYESKDGNLIKPYLNKAEKISIIQ